MGSVWEMGVLGGEIGVFGGGEAGSWGGIGVFGAKRVFLGRDQ